MWPIPLVDDDCQSTYLIKKLFKKPCLNGPVICYNLPNFRCCIICLASQEGINILFFLNNWKTVTKLESKVQMWRNFFQKFFFLKIWQWGFQMGILWEISPFYFYFSHFDEISHPGKKKKKTPQWTNATSVFFFDKFLHCGNQKNQLKNCKLNKGCVSHCGLVNYIKSILRQNRNYENLNISSCKNIILEKKSKSFKTS
jgi:hypothetical protein